MIDRRVNIGQTVVAGMNAPSLFLLAKDLGQCRLVGGERGRHRRRAQSVRMSPFPLTPIATECLPAKFRRFA